MKVKIESLVIDGELNGEMQGCDKGERGFLPPFALFSPDLQENVGGPYATRAHAEGALRAMRAGLMIPFTSSPVTWTVNDRNSEWYGRE